MPPDPPLEGPLWTRDPTMIERICRFRVRVWREAGVLAPDAFPDGVWRDALDATASHWVMTRGDRLVGAIRCNLFERFDDLPDAEHLRDLGLDLPGPIALPARVVVATDMQRRGLSHRLATASQAWARSQGVRYMVMEGSQAAIPGMLSRGRVLVGPGPPDTRFPGVAFQVLVADLDILETPGS